MKNNKGITLIALVVTIIVLLILAGVSIAMLSGQNGILNRASEAGDKSVVANAKEQIALAINEAMTEHYGNVYVDGGTSSIVSQVNAKLATTVQAINKQNKDLVSYGTQVSDTADGTITISYNNVTYTGTITKKTCALSWDK